MKWIYKTNNFVIKESTVVVMISEEIVAERLSYISWTQADTWKLCKFWGYRLEERGLQDG